MPDGDARSFDFDEFVAALRLGAGQHRRPDLRPEEAGLAQRPLHPRSRARTTWPTGISSSAVRDGPWPADPRDARACGVRATPLVQERMELLSEALRDDRLPAHRGRRPGRRGRRPRRLQADAGSVLAPRVDGAGGVDGVERPRRSRRRCAPRWSTASGSSRVRVRPAAGGRDRPAVSPPLFESMELLGRASSLARIAALRIAGRMAEPSASSSTASCWTSTTRWSTPHGQLRRRSWVRSPTRLGPHPGEQVTTRSLDHWFERPWAVTTRAYARGELDLLQQRRLRADALLLTLAAERLDDVVRSWCGTCTSAPSRRRLAPARERVALLDALAAAGVAIGAVTQLHDSELPAGQARPVGLPAACRVLVSPDDLGSASPTGWSSSTACEPAGHRAPAPAYVGNELDVGRRRAASAAGSGRPIWLDRAPVRRRSDRRGRTACGRRRPARRPAAVDLGARHRRTLVSAAGHDRPVRPSPDRRA